MALNSILANSEWKADDSMWGFDDRQQTATQTVQVDAANPWFAVESCTPIDVTSEDPSLEDFSSFTIADCKSLCEADAAEKMKASETANSLANVASPVFETDHGYLSKLGKTLKFCELV